MLRVLLFILGVIAAALGLAWLADRPGTVTIDWLGYQIDTSAFVGTLAVIAAAALLMLIWAFSRFLITRPEAIAAHLKGRRQRQGLDALSRGLLAIGIGDRTLAQKYASVARRTLPNEPLTALLRAQSAQLRGDRAAARRAFEAMLDRPDTELLGLRGLFLEAKRSGDAEAARALVEQAVHRNPQLGWSVEALFDLQARGGDWEGALNSLAIARQHGQIEADISNRRRACLLTAEAREAESVAPDKALALATEALRLAPSLVPAAEIAGHILASKGETRPASRLIAKTWKLSPHPDLALVYAHAKLGEPPRERLTRVKYLASLTPGDIEGQLAVAGAAIEAQDWEEARAALTPYSEDRPPARICTLMANVEAGEFGDKGREREWLARGLRAPRDRAWIADGYISDRWLPVSPVTGAVDAFEWKAPVDAIGRGEETQLIEEGQAETGPDAPHAIAADEPVSSEEAPAQTTEIDAAAWTGTTAPSTPKPKSGDEHHAPPPPPDDPGVGQQDSDESPASLERLRAAQIR